ncbi:hypothetical protein ENSA5_13790 [Enhygromyxa salina]|uniref:DUF2169 domain-containing protein n=1 Tax=Enhygromyxa salina TaxID=215803 RepID=A0A2S9YER8_9BACT|nr:DUF2169 domain-containing protein [Enhygromyxa salina]PRQ03624.1 hypothetical protein ENSA5_13790 [Enhygromyxa salina]
MLQLHNTSPFVPTIFALADRRGVDTLIAVVKATFELGAVVEIAAEQRPITLEDEYFGDPTASSLRYPSAVHLQKPGTDVILIGDACAPRGQAVPELDVALCVADRSKLIRVHGDRFWDQGLRAVQPSRAQPFVRVPIVYERAFGGRQVGDTGSGLADLRNPVGVGFGAGQSVGEMLGQPVPNFEDPNAPLTALGQTPEPMGFGAIAPTWQPRVAFAGTYDERWRKTRAPYLPDDFDPRYFHVGSRGMTFAQALRGGEPVAMHGFDPDRSWTFALPRCQLELIATLAGTTQRMNPILDTVVLEPSEARMTMTWRACLAVGEELLRVQRVDIGLGGIEGAVEYSGGEA